MSKILKLKIALAVFGGLGIGAFAMHTFTHSADSGATRNLASLKGPSLDLLPGAALAHMKHLALVTVRLDAPESIPLDSKDVVELNGTIVLNQGPAQDMDVEWAVPSDVQVVSGQLNFRILQMQPGKSYPVLLVVSGFDKTDKKVITVSASTTRNGIKVGNSSMVSSRPEDSMEYIAPSMADSAYDIDTAPRAGQIIK